MDFLKILFSYMTLVTVLGVQEGPLPQTVPTPTLLPAHVTATPVPYQTETPTATPGPTDVPVPTITPNARYETIYYQDRGTHVRKMQRRLIELGYLPEGSDDGAYGYQTYNAVKDFQRANGLSVDGAAGPATLTRLYEDPNVVTNNTPTPAPTATPTPTLPPLPTLDSVPVTPTIAPTASPTPTLAPTEAIADARPQETIAPPATSTATSTATPEPASPALLGLTEIPDALVINGNTGRPLSATAFDDGIPYTVKPQLWMNTAGDAVVLLHEMADCIEGWTFMGSSADGLYTLQAAGYEVSIQVTPTVVMVMVDGIPVALSTADVQALDGMLYVTDDFLEETLGAMTIFDAEERSLVFFIQDKAIQQSND